MGFIAVLQVPYDSIITRILQHHKLVYKESKKLEGETITALGFYRRNGEWVKTTFIKNQDTLEALEDDEVLNDVYLADQLSNF